MAKISTDKILEINEVYYSLSGRQKTYAETARRTGVSASTVKKYIDPDFSPVNESSIKRLSIGDIPEYNIDVFKGIENIGALCILSDEEKEEMKELWKEMKI